MKKSCEIIFQSDNNLSVRQSTFVREQVHSTEENKFSPDLLKKNMDMQLGWKFLHKETFIHTGKRKYEQKIRIVSKINKIIWYG